MTIYRSESAGGHRTKNLFEFFLKKKSKNLHKVWGEGSHNGDHKGKMWIFSPEIFFLDFFINFKFSVKKVSSYPFYFLFKNKKLENSNARFRRKSGGRRETETRDNL